MEMEGRGKLDELEIMFLSQTAQSTEILMQVERKARGFHMYEIVTNPMEK